MRFGDAKLGDEGECLVPVLLGSARIGAMQGVRDAVVGSGLLIRIAGAGGQYQRLAMAGGGLAGAPCGCAGGAEVVEDLGFEVAAACLAYQGESLVVVVKSFAVPAEPAVDVAELIQGAAFARKVTRPAPEAEGHLLVFERLHVTIQVDR